MKKIKLIVTFLLFAIGYIFNGELFILYLDGFQGSYYQSDFYFVSREKGIEEREIIEDFLNAAKVHEVDFFFLDSTIISAYSKDITVFGTPNALEALQANGIAEGHYNSLFMGETGIVYKDFSEITTIEKFTNCYYIGDSSQAEAMRLFKAELIGKYGGGLPKQFGSDRETWLNLFAVWSIIFGGVSLLSIYEIISLKKEITVRITLGEDVRIIFLKSAVQDAAIVAGAFISLPVILSRYSHVLFKFQAFMAATLVLLLINTLINAAILRVDFKKGLAARSNGGGLLVANYTLKTVTALLTLIVLAYNFTIIAQGYLMYEQRDFFTDHKEYSYYQLNYKVVNHLGKTMEDTTLMNQEFYRRFQNVSLQYNEMTANFNSPYPVLLINSNTFEEIAPLNASLAETAKSLEGDYFILLPAGIAENSSEHSIAEEIFNAFFVRTRDSAIKTVTYTGDLDLVGIHNLPWNCVSRIMRKPIILFNNTLQQADGFRENDSLYYAYSTMYNIPQKGFDDFVAEYQLTDQIVAVSNVFDVYVRNWTIVSRNMKLTVILTIFLLLLELSLISFIIKLEYQFNAMELALKKVLGYSLFSRNSRLMIITLTVFLLSAILAFLLGWLLGIKFGENLLWGGLILLAFEFVCILKKALTLEKANVPAILKGKVL